MASVNAIYEDVKYLAEIMDKESKLRKKPAVVRKINKKSKIDELMESMKDIKPARRQPKVMRIFKDRAAQKANHVPELAPEAKQIKLTVEKPPKLPALECLATMPIAIDVAVEQNIQTTQDPSFWNYEPVQVQQPSEPHQAYDPFYEKWLPTVSPDSEMVQVFEEMLESAKMSDFVLAPHQHEFEREIDEMFDKMSDEAQFIENDNDDEKKYIQNALGAIKFEPWGYDEDSCFERNEKLIDQKAAAPEIDPTKRNSENIGGYFNSIDKPMINDGSNPAKDSQTLPQTETPKLTLTNVLENGTLCFNFAPQKLSNTNSGIAFQKPPQIPASQLTFTNVSSNGTLCFNFGLQQNLQKKPALGLTPAQIVVRDHCYPLTNEEMLKMFPFTMPTHKVGEKRKTDFIPAQKIGVKRPKYKM